jgi:hypothetical protein
MTQDAWGLMTRKYSVVSTHSAPCHPDPIFFLPSHYLHPYILCFLQVTVGVDGMYGPAASPAQLRANPEVPPLPGVPRTCPEGWASRVGQDFVPNHRPLAIDYAGIHIW